MINLPFVIAHRGASAYAPENTLAAFKKAQALGAQWVEFDVVLAACGEAIIFHDEQLQRTSNGQGLVADFTYQALAQLDAGSWFNGAFAGEKIPRLQEVMEFLGQQQMGANVELKPVAGQEQALVTTVVKQIQQSWPETSPQPLLSSFNWDCLYQARTMANDLVLGLLVEQWHEQALTVAKQLQCVSIHVADEYLTQSLIALIKQQGFHVLSYTVNEPSRAQQLKEWGVTAVFTDYPDIICNAIADQGD